MLYFEFWRRWKDFSGKTKRGVFWKTFAIHMAVSFVLMLLLILAVVLLSGLAQTMQMLVFELLWSIYGIIWIVPMLAMMMRRLRDAGYTAKAFLWLLIPGLGGIALFARLCTQSADEQLIT